MRRPGGASRVGLLGGRSDEVSLASFHIRDLGQVGVDKLGPFGGEDFREHHVFVGDVFLQRKMDMRQSLARLCGARGSGLTWRPRCGVSPRSATASLGSGKGLAAEREKDAVSLYRERDNVRGGRRKETDILMSWM